VRVLASDTHRAHHGTELDRGRLVPSWESPDRADLVLAALVAAGFDDRVEPPPATEEELVAVHDPDYLRFLATAHDRWVADGREGHAVGFGWVPRRSAPRRPDDLDGELGWYAFAADCSITAGTWDAVRASAGLALAAAEHLAAGGGSAFALCRPPGHHATRDQFGGYCYVNNAAAAAQRLRARGAARVSILDIDYHHGNGTQDVFWERGDVQVVSIHADPRRQFPWFSGYADEVGDGDGLGTTVNLPLPRGADAPTWSGALAGALDAVARFGPDAVVVSLGVDTYVGDPISDFGLEAPDFRAAGGAVAALGRPTAFVLEGGYSTAAIGENVVSVLDGFLTAAHPAP
jgi:acetoin utilization deacetylase AcuC-like enzyme